MVMLLFMMTIIATRFICPEVPITIMIIISFMMMTMVMMLFMMAIIATRFHNSSQEPEMRHDVIPPLSGRHYHHHHGCSPFYLRPFYLPSLLPTSSR